MGCFDPNHYEFENRYIYEHYYEEFNVPDLLHYKNKKNHLYIRIWFTRERCDPVIYIFQYKNELWEGKSIARNRRFNTIDETLITAEQKTWENLWEKLIAMNFFYMKDWSQTQCFIPSTLDGWSIDVEILMGHKYRNFSYDHPEIRHCIEAQTFIIALNIIFEDLNLVKPIVQ